ncbi:MAG: dihydropteroate synthase [Myxococcota bacterium]
MPPAIALGSVRLDFGRPVLIGILNITPDSFSDGGQLAGIDAVVQRAGALVDAGATVLDIGGESTRPGSGGVDAGTEIERVAPAIDAIRKLGLPAALSIDTSKARVAEVALQHGAAMVNDVSALRDPKMAGVVAAHGAALILLHMRGEPRSMQEGEIRYDDLLADIRGFLDNAVERAVDGGVARERILVDPGIGFGKTVEHNLSLTRRLGELSPLGRPVVFGPSRKRFLGAVTGRGVTDLDRATAAACVAAVLAGAHALRVHDVEGVRDAVEVALAVRDAP